MRERLDEVDPRQLRAVFKHVFTLLQRGKGLEGFTCLDGHYVLSVDGTGYFSSSHVHCAQCCEKHHRDGRTTDSHQMLGAVLVHPDKREVFALAPEPIVKGDGAKKNDCERNAAKRLLSDVRREHPHLKLLVVEDGLASNGPHIKHLKGLDLRFILGAKRADHEALFEWVEATQRLRHGAVKQVEHTDEQGIHHRFRFLIDQVQQRGCTLFAKARAKAERPHSLWDKSLPPSPIGGAQAVPDLPRGGLGDLVPGDCVRIPGRDGAL